MNYFTILTNAGISAITQARAEGRELNLTLMAVGDGGTPPSATMTSLVNETYRFNINALYQDTTNTGRLIVEGIIPVEIGGFNVSEVALYTEDGVMFAVGSLPATYKPTLEEGSAKGLTIKMIIEVANADIEIIQILVDDSVVLATKEFVNTTLESYILTSDAVSKVELDLFQKDTINLNGFEDKNTTNISFNNTDRVFTIEPKDSDYTVYVSGNKFVKTEAITITVPDIAGQWFIYFDEDGNIQAGQIDFMDIENAAAISYIYWNKILGKAVIIGDERHTIFMNRTISEYLHINEGARHIEGLEMLDYSITETGDDDSDVQFSISNGKVQNEDLIYNIQHSDTPINNFEQVLSPIARIPVVYKSGIDGVWNINEATDFPIILSSLVPQYNLKTTGWALHDVPDKSYYAVWIVATNSIKNPIIAVVGQSADNNLDDARANNDFKDLNLEGLRYSDFKQLYRLIFKYDLTFTNQARSSLTDLLDIKGASVKQTTGAQQIIKHSDLVGRGAEAAHPASAITMGDTTLDKLLGGFKLKLYFHGGF